MKGDHIMATVTATVVGGKATAHEDIYTVAELKQKLNITNYQASINGEPVSDEDDLTDGDYVTFSPQVKGA
jgi:hypothetical protein